MSIFRIIGDILGAAYLALIVIVIAGLIICEVFGRADERQNRGGRC